MKTVELGLCETSVFHKMALHKVAKYFKKSTFKCSRVSWNVIFTVYCDVNKERNHVFFKVRPPGCVCTVHNERNANRPAQLYCCDSERNYIFRLRKVAIIRLCISEF